jgi:WhiB family redox-sensing transcriptional regulator
VTDTCIHGHPWTPDNTIFRPHSRGGIQRECRACHRRKMRARREAAFTERHAGHDIAYDAAGRRRCLTCPRRRTDADDIAAMSRTGMTATEIATRTGCAERTVTRILTRTRKAPAAMVRYAPDTLDRPDRWSTDAACRETDPELFYPDPTDALTIAQAKTICAGCPVRQTCADDALTRREKHGIWGGLTESQRHNLLRARTRAVKAVTAPGPP